jgi:hypothetical protein
MLMPSCAVAQATLPSSEPIIVMQRVNSRYDLPDNLSAALDKALPAQVQVRPAEGITSILSRLYSVGDHSVKPAVGPLISWIRARNNLPENLALAAGQPLTVPDVPKLALTAPGAANPNNRVAKLSLDLRPLNDLAGLIRIDSERGLDEAQRPGAAVVVSIRQLTASQAADALNQDPDLTLVSAPLNVKFLDDALHGSATTATPALSVIQIAATRPVMQHPILFVFDDNWPSLAEEEASRTYLLTAIRDLRSKLLMPPMKAFSLACSLGAKVTDWPDAGRSHSAEIAEALVPFKTVAPAAAVKVVYVPAIAAGPCASEVIGQIAEFHLIAEHMADVLGKEPALPDIVKGYHALAAQVVARIDVAETNRQAKTDVEAIQGLFEFARLYGAFLSQPVFVSMSWDFPLDRYFPKVPSEFGGLFVVAAGNDGTDDQGNALPPVIQTKIQFAARSAHPGDMLAVMNVDDAGKLTCYSSLVDPAGMAFATSYPGDISQTTCGTSFSTPRVAWLLALRESTRSPLADLTNLSQRIRQDFTTGLNGPAAETGVYRLDVDKLLSATK